MELEKAIEIMTDLLGEGPQYPPDDRREAVKLGIEALKELLELRQTTLWGEWEPLLGETKGVADV